VDRGRSFQPLKEVLEAKAKSQAFVDAEVRIEEMLSVGGKE